MAIEPEALLVECIPVLRWRNVLRRLGSQLLLMLEACRLLLGHGSPLSTHLLICLLLALMRSPEREALGHSATSAGAASFLSALTLKLDIESKSRSRAKKSGNPIHGDLTQRSSTRFRRKSVSRRERFFVDQNSPPLKVAYRTPEHGVALGSCFESRRCSGNEQATQMVNSGSLFDTIRSL